MATKSTRGRKVPGEKMVSIPQRELDELHKDLASARTDFEVRTQEYRSARDRASEAHSEVNHLRNALEAKNHEIETLRSNLAIADGYIQRCLEDDAMRERGDKAERTGPTYRDGGRGVGLFSGTHDFTNWMANRAAE